MLGALSRLAVTSPSLPSTAKLRSNAAELLLSFAASDRLNVSLCGETNTIMPFFFFLLLNPSSRCLPFGIPVIFGEEQCEVEMQESDSMTFVLLFGCFPL